MALTAIEALTHHQRQLDTDGVEVGVSRQALDEVLALVAAQQAALEAVRIHMPDHPDTAWQMVDDALPDTPRASYERCPSCDGTGLATNDAGEPDICRECKGDTVVPAEAQAHTHVRSD